MIIDMDEDCGDDQPANTLELFAEYDLVISMIDDLPNSAAGEF